MPAAFYLLSGSASPSPSAPSVSPVVLSAAVFAVLVNCLLRLLTSLERRRASCDLENGEARVLRPRQYSLVAALVLGMIAAVAISFRAGKVGGKRFCWFLNEVRGRKTSILGCNSERKFRKNPLED